MPREMELSGAWEVLPVNRFDGKYDAAPGWRPAQVPGHWRQVPGLETYSGKAVYRKRFAFTPQPDRRFFLRLGGVFYWHTAYLNGVRLGANEGYFFPTDYELTGLLAQDNELIVEVDCPDEPDKTYKRQLTGVFHHWDCIAPRSNPGGLWRPVEIFSTGPARLTDPFFATAYLGPDHASARVLGRLTLDTETAADLRLRIDFIPRTFDGPTISFERSAFKSPGPQTFHYSLDLPHPTLWWTHDQGRPDLYALRIQVFAPGQEGPSDEFETGFGVRTFELRDYIAFLNGRRLYLRGNNYPPGDTLIATMDRERVQQDVALAKAAHLNLLRVHAHVDQPELYHVCDREGVLLWQDFPMQWYYRPEVEAQALRQLEKMVLLLGTHPSVGVWCMHNEPFRAFDLKDRYRPGQLEKALFTFLFPNHNRDRMDKMMERRAQFLDPFRPAFPSSGERGLFKKSGDVHLYHGWYFGPMSWFHKKYQDRPDQLRFITEFGAQSFPNLDSATKFMAPRLEDLDWKELERSHGLQLFFLKFFVNPKRYPTLEAFIQATQDYQARLNRYHIDRVRALKYKPGGGCVPFILVDSYPAVLWSVVDYWRVPKASYFALQKAMSPVYAFVILDRETMKLGQIARLAVHAVNDRWRPAEVRVDLTVTSPLGETVLTQSHAQTLPADSEAVVLGVPEVRLRFAGDYLIALKLSGPDGELANDYVLHVK